MSESDTFTLRSRNRCQCFAKPSIMGVVNLSSDSFINPQQDFNTACIRVDTLVAEGAHFIDIGAEATNPKAELKSTDELLRLELEQLIPLVKYIKKKHDVWVSVDTSRAMIMRAAVNAGADMINDQRMLTEPNAIATAIDLQVPVCLMHGLVKQSANASRSPAELMVDIKTELMAVVNQCIQQGMDAQCIILDPGFGRGHYGKTTAENIYLLKHLVELTELGYPLLTAWSRKSMLGELLGDAPVEQRLFASIAADTLAAYFGSGIIRTHDVKATADAISVAQAVLKEIN